MPLAPLPLGYSYTIGQGFVHAPAPPMDHVYPGTQMGMPARDYEDAIRGLTPEARIWGPSQINAMFTYLSNNAPIRTDEERTDPSKFACTYDASLRVTRERVIYFLAPDGPADNPANWKKACQVYGWSEANSQWTFPQASKVDITIWYQSGAGEHYDYSISPGEWFSSNWKMIAATIAVVASLVVSIVTLGGASALTVAAVAFVGACASAAPKLADGFEKGDYKEILAGVSEIGRAGAALTGEALKEIQQKDPKLAAWATGVAAQVSAVYDRAKAAAGGAAATIEGLANQGLAMAGGLAPLLPNARALTRENLGPVGAVFWDAAEKIPLKDLPNFAATQIPWYAQGAIELQAAIRAIEEAQAAAAAARQATQVRLANPALSTLGQTVRIATLAPQISRTAALSTLASKPAAVAAPTTNDPNKPAASSSLAPIILAALAAMGIVVYQQRKR